MSDSDDTDSDVPDCKTAQELCEKFADITGTDTACAQFYLQDRKWNLEASVNAYFESNKAGDTEAGDDSDQLEIIVSPGVLANAKTVPAIENETPKRMKLISWNVDGLHEVELKRRTKVVCNIINSELPDVVFLQEVILETKEYIEHYLPDYQCYAANDEGYFTVTLLRKSTTMLEAMDVIPFPTSRMGRNLLVLKVKINDHFVVLMNTHLESTKEHAEERVKQLKAAFKKMQSYATSETVIFGGDLNLRDKESALVGLASDVVDLWEATGQREECKYTWDMMRNDNHTFSGRFKPRCRFDRLYLKQADPIVVKPAHFGLVGLERLKSCRRFPSDHWGLVVYFEFV